MRSTPREKGSSIIRVLEIIEAVAAAKDPLTPTALAEKLGIPKASAHRLVQTLESEGFLQFGLRGGLLPGERLHATAVNILNSGRHKALRQAILRELSADIGETCGLSVPDGLDMLYFDRVQTNWPLQINLPIGSHTPLWCTASGKLYLASLPPEQLERVLPRLPIQQMARNTLTDLSALRDDLARVREEDMGTDSEEFIDGMVACAVPVRDAQGRLIACLFSHAPVIRCSMEQLLGFVPRMRAAAKELEGIVGG
ncbi:IclR family transcriptional regulator [Stutzerimonas nitrititolerans]|uniref:IclR family transcriptional regulator n=1 Tax=Stutzerimonas nitrititolerans TaxID=2482751 RepID=UPI0028AA788B|nr:IclR family transcriptional regulator [Stutzerimonas nitrititolerans]